jgi:hypothetical protein
MCFHYYDGRCRTSQRDQLRQIRELGFDVIHTEESPVAPGRPRGTLDPIVAWNHIEIGRNRYDWGFLDRLVEDCAAVGLQLFHDIELVHHLPGWVARQYPDTEVISPTGERLGFYHRPFCYADYHMRCYSLAHPAARAAAAAPSGVRQRRLRWWTIPSRRVGLGSVLERGSPPRPADLPSGVRQCPARSESGHAPQTVCRNTSGRSVTDRTFDFRSWLGGGITSTTG